MKVPQLFCGALALALLISGCNRPESRADAERAASDAATRFKVGAVKAGNGLADVWLSTKVHSKFVGDRDIDAKDIKVSSKDGVVTLQGRVLNEPMRQLAVAIAKNTDGVSQVVNQLGVETIGPVPPVQAENGATPGAVATSGHVDATASTGVDDARITSSIQSKYYVDDRIRERRINVTSNAGVVTLSGDVADDTERAEALLLARTTEGVTRVEDNLTIAPAAAASAPDLSADTSARADQALSARIQSQLSADAQVKDASIEVTAKNGVVLLQGTVGSAAAKQRALTMARSTEGVTQVVDRLQVGKAKR